MEFFSDTATLRQYFDMGGFVMPPLVLVSVLLWYALIYRLMTLQGGRRDPRELVERAFEQSLQGHSITAKATRYAVQTARDESSVSRTKSLINEHFGRLRIELGRYRSLVRSLVAVAPLLGLLGTVDGMIETFDSLGDMALFSATGGIAGGISKALFTTQMGLAVSIPGLLLGQIIERRQRNLQRQLDQIRDLVCARI